VVLLELVNEVPLVICKLRLVYKFRCSQVADEVHNVSLVGQSVYTLTVKFQALHTLTDTPAMLAAACDPLQEPSELTIPVCVMVALSPMELFFDLRGDRFGILAFLIRARVGATAGAVYIPIFSILNPVRMNVLVHGVEALQLLSLLRVRGVTSNTASHDGPD
jgi:hypothetical protein